MADNTNTKGPEDRSKINLSQEHEVRYWAKELNVSEDQLRAIVKQVGNSVSAVRGELPSA